MYAPYAQLLRDNPPVERSYFNVDSYAFKGPAYYDGTKYQKLKIDDEDAALDRDIGGGWVAALQHHFVAAIVPPAGEAWRYTAARCRATNSCSRRRGASRSVAPGASADAARKRCSSARSCRRSSSRPSPRLDLVADYGMLTLLAQPLFWLLEKVHTLVGNWGLAIIIVTFLLKLAVLSAVRSQRQVDGAHEDARGRA